MAIGVMTSTFAQKQFEVEVRYPSAGVTSKKITSLAKLSDADINKAFKAIRTSGMEFRYPQGGCQQRAEMMHAILHDIGIDHAKIWLFAPSNTDPGSQTKLEINDPNGLVLGGKITWGYHVAPLIMSSRGDTLILDPSISRDAPIKLRDWFRAINNSSVSSYTILDPNQFFFYTDGNGKITGSFYKYEPLAGYSTMYDKLVLEREIAVNDVAMFLKGKLDNGYADSANQIRTLVSNVNNMVNFFAASEKMEAYLSGVTVRNLLTKHPALMNEAMKYYADRVTYWTDFKGKLR